MGLTFGPTNGHLHREPKGQSRPAQLYALLAHPQRINHQSVHPFFSTAAASSASGLLADGDGIPARRWTRNSRKVAAWQVRSSPLAHSLLRHRLPPPCRWPTAAQIASSRVWFRLDLLQLLRASEMHTRFLHGSKVGPHFFASFRYAESIGCDCSRNIGLVVKKIAIRFDEIAPS